MELVATIWDATKCLCNNWTTKHAAFICHLEENLQSLAEEWTQLQNISHDMNTRVQHAERMAHMRRTREVEGWLQTVNSMEQMIENIQQRSAKEEQNKCLGKFCQKNCLSSYELGKDVDVTLKSVKNLIANGKGINNVALEMPHEPADEMPVPKIVGMDLMLKKVWDSIEEEDVSLIGLYGMGGAGKTTLLKKLHNEFAKGMHDFTLIWVDVAKAANIDKIMETIRKKCGIVDNNWRNRSKNERVLEIYKIMKQKKFILFLDNIWEELKLDSMGVPPPNQTKQSKILFTTRFENVCDQMQAKKFKVECLTAEDAWDLFCMKVSEETLNSRPSIRPLARELMQECKGLPLALVTVGQAMAGRNNPQAWKHAIKELKSFPSEVLGMEKEVFFTLKFSYDSLPSATMKKCFLYCALYPKDIKIYVPHIICLWIGEGFLEEHESIYDAYDHGQHIVEGLKLACLLEVDDDYLWAKMHDVLRDMALWLARDQDQIKSKVLVQGQNNLDQWNITERISLVYSKADRWHVPICPNLVTLILQDNVHIEDFVNVQFMRRLKVLCLIDCRINLLPPEIGQLIHLEYFELSRMSIKERFPVEMKSLNRLSIFLVQHADFSLEIIPLEVISSLKRLRVLFFTTLNAIEKKTSLQKMRSLLLMAIHSSHTVEKSFLEQLELLPLLENVRICLQTSTGINKLLSSTKLRRCTTLMELLQYRKTSINIRLTSSMKNMEHLERLTLVGVQDNLEVSSINNIGTFHMLRWVTISDCDSITHLTWLKHAPFLYQLTVQRCNLVEEVIIETEDDKGEENMDDIFQSLKKVSLIKLPKLKGIYNKALPFPVLQYMKVLNCPNLKKLPLDSNSARNNLKQIRGELQWWDNLEWEDPAIKEIFHSKYLAYTD